MSVYAILSLILLGAYFKENNHFDWDIIQQSGQRGAWTLRLQTLDFLVGYLQSFYA